MVRTSRATHRRATSADDHLFPLLVAAGSTVAALALFFSTTVDAIAESHHLNRVLAEHAEAHTTIRRDLNLETTRRVSLKMDAQAITLELDRRGIFPAETLPDSSPRARLPGDQRVAADESMSAGVGDGRQP